MPLHSATTMPALIGGRRFWPKKVPREPARFSLVEMCPAMIHACLGKTPRRVLASFLDIVAYNWDSPGAAGGPRDCQHL
jgi:hypothetical protein